MRKKITYKDMLINFALLFFTMILFIALFEIVVRIFNLYPIYGSSKGMFQKDELLDYSMAPNFVGALIKQEFKVPVLTNSYGLRDQEYNPKKSKDFRILALGDSFAWGYGATLNQAYIKILEKELNKNQNKINYQVINAGVPGYGTDQEILYLINRGSKLEPDLVILNFFVGNDFLDNMEMGELTVKEGFLATNKLRVKISDKIRTFLLLNFHSYRIIERSIINIFGNFIQKLTPAEINQNKYQSKLFLKPTNVEINKQIIKTKELLNNLKVYLDSKNTKLVIIIIPLKYQVDDNLKQLFIKKNYDKKDFIDMEMPQKIIKEWGLENNVTVIDILPKLSSLNKNNDFYWRLNAHFNIKGNEVVGTIIYDELINKSVLG